MPYETVKAKTKGAGFGQTKKAIPAKGMASMIRNG